MLRDTKLKNERSIPFDFENLREPTNKRLFSYLFLTPFMKKTEES